MAAGAAVAWALKDLRHQAQQRAKQAQKRQQQGAERQEARQ